MNIAVVGTGYVGLVSGTCFAESGNEVICVDIDRARVGAAAAGSIPIYEPGLGELVSRNLKERRLSFTCDLPAAVAQSMVSFVAVGTPMSANGAADLSGVLSVSKDIARAAVGYHIIAIKSTVPIGTNDRVRERVRTVFDLYTRAGWSINAIARHLNQQQIATRHETVGNFVFEPCNDARRGREEEVWRRTGRMASATRWWISYWRDAIRQRYSRAEVCLTS